MGGDPGRADDAVGVAGERQDVAAVCAQFRLRRADRAGVRRRRIGAADLDDELAVGERRVAHQHFVARRQRRRAVRRIDRTVVLDPRGDQGDIAAERADLAVVDDNGVARTGECHGAAIQEIAVGHIKGRGDERAADVNDPVLADDDAVAVDQIDRTGRRQAPVNRRDRRAGHPVEGRPAAVGEVDRLAGPDREGRPVDDRMARRLVDRQAGIADS